MVLCHLSPSLCSAGTKEDGGEGIYGNLQHHRLGAMGHARERWEFYCKTQT